MVCFRAPIGACFLLCDGLGGHGRGDVASQLVCAEFRQNARTTQETEPIHVLSNALLTAQAALRAKQEELRCPDSMLTTVCAVIITTDRIVYTHIGDSRIYFFDEKRGYTRTLDHSVPQMLATTGAIRERAIRHHPDRNRILRAMGSEWERPPFEITSVARPFAGKGAVLMCTDGLWEWLSEREMIRLKLKARTPGQWLSDMMRLAEKHAEKNNMDNHSGIAIFSAVR